MRVVHVIDLLTAHLHYIAAEIIAQPQSRGTPAAHCHHVLPWP